jgi:hypothetical protein
VAVAGGAGGAGQAAEAAQPGATDGAVLPAPLLVTAGTACMAGALIIGRAARLSRSRGAVRGAPGDAR